MTNNGGLNDSFSGHAQHSVLEATRTSAGEETSPAGQRESASELKKKRLGGLVGLGLVAIALAVSLGVSGISRTDTATSGSSQSVALTSLDSAEQGEIDLSWLPSTDVQGREFSADIVTGKSVAVVKWASWCPPCGGSAFLSSVQAWSDAHPDVVPVVLLVSDNLPEAQTLIEASALKSAYFFAMPRTQVFYGGSEFDAGFPSALLLDNQHRVVAVSSGAQETSSLFAVK